MKRRIKMVLIAAGVPQKKNCHPQKAVPPISPETKQAIDPWGALDTATEGVVSWTDMALAM